LKIVVIAQVATKAPSLLEVKISFVPDCRQTSNFLNIFSL
jgi:hypothetical protein